MICPEQYEGMDEWVYEQGAEEVREDVFDSFIERVLSQHHVSDFFMNWSIDQQDSAGSQAV